MTGIFFLYLEGERLSDFPRELEGILERDDVLFYEAFFEIPPVDEELILKVHSRNMVDAVKRSVYWETALYSSGGVVLASEEIYRGRIRNAFVFTGVGDHHAGRNSFWGGCFLNGAALAIENLREKYGIRKFAILDTDSYHGDGTRDIFAQDDDVLHFCFCSLSQDRGTKVDIRVPFPCGDEFYPEKIRTLFRKKVEEIKPYMIFWEYGYDATSGDYGSRGISMKAHVEMAREVKRIADEFCEGRLVVILCGGSRRDIANYTIPRIIKTLLGG